MIERITDETLSETCFIMFYFRLYKSSVQRQFNCMKVKVDPMTGGVGVISLARPVTFCKARYMLGNSECRNLGYRQIYLIY